MKISLIIPIKNEEQSLESLCSSIANQTRQPNEIILVDGGSTDRTVELAGQIILKQSNFRLIETPQASPGRGRNIGTENARCEWIAFTDAGIVLEPDWLEKLVEKAAEDEQTDIVYGNYAPVINNNFEKIAALAYVPAQIGDGIRGKSIASYLMRKKVWEAVGGFPDLRAAEDLMFMEAAEKQNFKFALAPDALIRWQLRPNLSSTFRKFVLYSKHNVWAGRQWDWHYGILKQYLVLIPFVLLSVFYSWWGIAFIVLWLIARTFKRILPHRSEFGLPTLLNPLIFFGAAFLILVIDAATFIGWGQALLGKRK